MLNQPATPEPGSPEVVALHEAAHAIVGVMVGMIVERCTVTPDGKRYAHVLFEDGYRLPEKCHHATSAETEQVERYAREALAAHFAEKKKWGMHHVPGSDDDRAIVRSLADKLYPEGPDHHEWQTRMMTRARKDVDLYWPAIEELAQEILAHGDRTHADVVAVLKRQRFSPP